MPITDWVLALVAAFCGAYLMIFYRELAERPGQPSTMDLWTAVIGMVLLLEATRRAVGWPMAVLALLCLVYVFAGPYMPDVLMHKGSSISRTMSQMWLTTEGVFGVALGVSVSTIFVYVLFGSLLDVAGGGNYMMQVSFAALGHLRGGPAKVAVVSSALNGVVSGSSVANVVSGGIFTIPLMKRAGYGGIKAGAIETMASVNGQIMPPVMGAAAFLMTEYVGIPYSEVVKHADPAGGAVLHRALLHRPSRGGEAGPEADDRRAAAALHREAQGARARRLRQHRGDVPGVLRHRRRPRRARRERRLGDRAHHGGAVPAVAPGRRPRRRTCRRTSTSAIRCGRRPGRPCAPACTS